MTDLGTLGGFQPSSTPYAINDSGVIVGISQNHGFIYVDGVMRDLNDLLAFKDWTIGSANDINNEGQIVCNAGVFSSRAVLLTPVTKWAVNRSDTWPVDGNWTANAPNGVGSAAQFDDVITAPRTV